MYQVQAEPATTICIKGNDVETCSEVSKIYYPIIKHLSVALAFGLSNLELYMLPVTLTFTD